MKTDELPKRPPVELSLSVSNGYNCFELSSKEKTMGPEDWAWRFLRLNLAYRQAYGQAVRKMIEDPRSSASEANGVATAHFFNPYSSCRKVFVDEQECRESFGLSTWLDPNLPDLPKLSEGESWFSPLKSVIAEPRFDALKEGLFGYSVLHKYIEHQPGKPIRRKSNRSNPDGGERRQPWMEASVWFAVDCSVPPDAQLATIEFIANRYAAEMRNGKLTSAAFYSENLTIKPLKGDRLLAEMDFRNSLAVPDKDRADVWRLVKICLVGHPGRDIEKCRKLLQKVHGQLVDLERAASTEHKRLRMQPEVTLGEGAISPKDVHVLKALVIITECHRAGIVKSMDIVDVLAEKGAGSRVYSAPGGKKYIWLDDKIERAAKFDALVERAEAYVRSGYKWLIYSQKPKPEH